MKTTTKVIVKYFGEIEELCNSSLEEFTTNSKTIDELLEEIYSKHPSLKERKFSVAQNQKMVQKNEQISGKEIALLPAFSGG